MAKNNKAPRKPKVVVQNCPECKGNPTRTPFELDDFTGERCEKCFIVLDFAKKGK